MTGIQALESAGAFCAAIICEAASGFSLGRKAAGSIEAFVSIKKGTRWVPFLMEQMTGIRTLESAGAFCAANTCGAASGFSLGRKAAGPIETFDSIKKGTPWVPFLMEQMTGI